MTFYESMQEEKSNQILLLFEGDQNLHYDISVDIVNRIVKTC